MLAYAVGRIGCQVSGDGDWGILNSAYITTPDSKVELVDSSRFNGALNTYANYYNAQFNISNPSETPHKFVKAPTWLPDWTVAYAYPHNVIGEGVPIEGCSGQYCNHLPIPVFPTPFYETVACLFLFFLLWSVRKKLVIPGTMFSLYLIVNGLERFFIEKIRVNTKYDIMGFHPTQAELISSLMVLTGIALFLHFRNKYRETSI
jgi:prolipoprotein diacylglyceryltransferase